MSVLVTIALGGCQPSPAGTSSASNGPAPPVADTRPHVVTMHGQTLTDEYFWLREKTNPQVMDYLKAEDAYAEAMMKPTAALQDALYQEILGHIKQTDETVPYLENGYFYYSRTREGLQYPVYCRKRGSLTAAEEVVLDQNELAKGQAFLSVGARAVSDDGNLLAFTVDTTGYRQYTLRVKDLRTGTLLPDSIERVDDIAWATDNKTIFYVTEDAVTKRHDRFWRHWSAPAPANWSTTRKTSCSISNASARATRRSSCSKPPPRRPLKCGICPPIGRPTPSGSSRRGSRITNTTSTTAATCGTSARTRTRRTFASSPRRPGIPRRSTGPSSSPIVPT